MDGASGENLRRFERRLSRRLGLSRAANRVWQSLPAVLQIVAGAVAAYSICRYLLGHPTPILAATVTISTLGFARDARPRRVLNAVIGILVGVVLSEVLLLSFGRGLWQIAVVLAVTLAVARFISPSNAFAIAAGVQSMLVLLLPAPEGGVFTRTLDAAVGGVIALLVTALIPRDPRRAARKDGRTLFSVFEESLGSVVDALIEANEAAAELALARLRRTQVILDDWTVSLDTAIAVARTSPWLRRHLPELRVQARVLEGADLASRHLRLLARRIEFLVSDGRSRPVLAGLVAELSTAIRLLGAEIDDRELAGASRSLLSDLATRLAPESLLPGAEVTDSVIVLLVRPLVVDLLVATGMPIDDARALLPEA